MSSPNLTRFATLLAAGCLAAACGIGGIGAPANPAPSQQTVTRVDGTVDHVDTRSRIVFVQSDSVQYGQALRNGSRQVPLYYDSGTVVRYQGRTFEPADLEQGDQVQADVDENGGRLVAREIDVVYDVSQGTTAPEERSATVQGLVDYVDTRDLTIQLSNVTYSSGFTPQAGTTTGDRFLVAYDAGTPVEFNGRQYTPANLERGDRVEVAARETATGNWVADRITVLSDVRSRTPSPRR